MNRKRMKKLTFIRNETYSLKGQIKVEWKNLAGLELFDLSGYTLEIFQKMYEFCEKRNNKTFFYGTLNMA